jgi:ABC-2 type transport system ATP-binding protein
LKTLASIPGVKNVTCTGMQEKNSNDFIIEPDGNTDVRRSIFNRLAERNWPLMLMQSNELSLEQIFLRLTEMSDEEQQRLFGKTEDEVAETPEVSEEITKGEEK